MAAVAVGAAAIGGQVAGQYFASEAQKKATKYAAKKQFDIAQGQLDWLKQQRGQGGSPVGLGLYTGDYEQKQFGVGSSLMDLTNRDYRDVLAKSRADVSDASSALRDYAGTIASGARGQQRLNELAPVTQARSRAARTAVQASTDATNSALSRLAAINAAYGYSNTGMPAINRLAALRYQANMDQSNAISAADLENAINEQAVREANWNEFGVLASQYPEIAQQLIQIESMPGQLMLQDWAARYGSSTTPARINQQYTQIPGYTPIFSGVSTAGNMLSAASGGLSGLSQMLANKKLADDLAAIRAGQSSYPASYDYNNYSPDYMQYADYGAGSGLSSSGLYGGD